jgi:hypothetical protein
MTLRATVRNGIIPLPADLAIPDGTEVEIEILQDVREAGSAGADPFACLGDDAVDLGVTDLSAEHDHYTYGSPKRREQQ